MTGDHPRASDPHRDAQGRPFRALVTCDVFEPGFRGGGPVRSVGWIVDTAPEHIDVTLVTSDRDVGSTEPYPRLSGRWARRGRNRVFYLDISSPRQWLRLQRELNRDPFDLLYVNSLWSPVFTVVPILAARLGLIRARRVLIAPRGELSAGALSLKSRKKHAFLTWYGRLLKDMGVSWHAASDSEAADIQSVCPWAHVAVNHVQVGLPPEPLPATRHTGVPRLVFLGRIVAMKNLALTLQALRAVTQAVEFDIYGPLEDPVYWSKCQVLIDRLPTSVQVRYRGELPPGEVRRVFSGYDASVFPTMGESFGHAIAESLSASCPVICSERTPWTEVLESGGGRVVRPLSADSLSRELQRIVALTPTERLEVRQLAGGAYRSWRQSPDGPNILELARSALEPVPR
jgi:glycosyltransferase involved in cell wall biosynthesis